MIVKFENGIKFKITVKKGIVKSQKPIFIPTYVENEWKKDNRKIENQVVLNIPLERALRVLKQLNGSYSIE